MKHSKFYYLTHPNVTRPALWAKISDRYAIEQQWNKVMGYPRFSQDLKWRISN